MRQKNNPFKMILPWIGVIIGFFVQLKYLDTIDIFGFLPTFNNQGIVLNIGWTITGFILGWVITILWRKIK